MLLLKNFFKRPMLSKALPVMSRAMTTEKTGSGCDCGCCCGGASSLTDFEPAPVLSPAPAFKAKAWHDGFKDINLADYKGKYVVLFFYPLDFTFVCPTEIIEFSKKSPKFRETNCEVIGCSVDSVFAHMEYNNKPRDEGGLGGLDIPLIGDLSKEVADSFGVLVREGENKGVAFRATFIIDTKGIIRHKSINDLPVGRNVDEILRLVKAFQFVDKHGEVCPATWKPGDKGMTADSAGVKSYLKDQKQSFPSQQHHLHLCLRPLHINLQTHMCQRMKRTMLFRRSSPSISFGQQAGIGLAVVYQKYIADGILKNRREEEMREFPIESRQVAEEKKKVLKSAGPVLLSAIRESEIGSEAAIRTHYGTKPLVYADYTASGRALTFLEDYVRDQVLTSYANTHSESSACAIQTHYLREEARAIVKRCTNCCEKDVALFVGSGFTGALNKLIDCMKLKELVQGKDKSAAEQNYCYANRWGSYDCVLCNMPFSNKGLYQEHEKSAIHTEQVKLREQKAAEEKAHSTTPVVIFVSKLEHHSNILPWRETDALVETIGINEKTGDLDYAELEAGLEKHKNARLRIGSFSACSNVTGMCPNIDLIAYILHSHGALCVLDYAAAAPYLAINMNGPTYEFEKTHAKYPALDPKRYLELTYKDAIVFSAHKFIGGTTTSGVLLAKRDLFTSSVPAAPGGGTVLYVGPNEHMYVGAIEQREEAGTPAIVECIKTGLVMQLKEAVGEELIEKCEQTWVRRAKERFRVMSNVVLLEKDEWDISLKRVGIFAFNVKSHGRLLHYNFVVKLLNDMFGVQSRGGCACAAVYGLHLLGVDEELAKKYNQAIGKGYEIIRLGFVRINFAYWIDEETFQYILSAIEWVAKNGWKLLPHYTFDVASSVWQIRTGDVKETKRAWLQRIDYSSGRMEYPREVGTFIKRTSKTLDLENMLKSADASLAAAIDEYKHIYGRAQIDQSSLFAEADIAPLRWFLLPSEVIDKVKKEEDPNCELKLPFVFGKKELPAEPPKEKSKAVEAQPEEEEFAFPDTAAPAKEEEKAAKVAKKLVADIPEKVIKLVGEAIQDFDMIKEKDKVLVCVSGGKDSLSLLHILLKLQARAPVHFEIGAVTVDPQTPQYNPLPLVDYMKRLGVPYFLESEAVVEKAKTCMQKNSICAFCSRMRRGIIYRSARTHGYNVIALGQHLDDLAESFMMSTLHNGRLRTMKANYMNDKGDVRVIRPLVYCREKCFKEVAEECKLPVIVDNCPACFAAPKERHRIKLMLAQQEHVFPTIFSSLLQSMKPLMVKRPGALGEPEDKDEDEEGDGDAQCPVQF